jgi:hypothetical protein
MLSNVVSEDCGLTQNEVNATRCYSRDGGSAFAVYDTSTSYATEIVITSFLTIVDCSGNAAVYNYRKKPSGSTILYTSISFSNFYNNSVTSGVVYGNTQGVNLTSCVFFGNQKDVGFSSVGSKCVINKCVFSKALPSSSHFSGANNIPNSITASISIQQFDNENCVLVIQPTASATQSNQFDSSNGPPAGIFPKFVRQHGIVMTKKFCTLKSRYCRLPLWEREIGE